MRAVVLTLPGIRVERGQPDCWCGLVAEAGEHTTTPAECFGKLAMGCHDPAAHHAYRPLPWWRRLHVRKAVGW